MPKYRDPGADDRMKEFESSLREVMQEKPKKKAKKKECSPCGQKSLTGSTYNG
jgi:hypothetical protein